METRLDENLLRLSIKERVADVLAGWPLNLAETTVIKELIKAVVAQPEFSVDSDGRPNMAAAIEERLWGIPVLRRINPEVRTLPIATGIDPVCGDEWVAEAAFTTLSPNCYYDEGTFRFSINLPVASNTIEEEEVLDHRAAQLRENIITAIS